MIEFFHECKPPTATAQARRHNRSGATYMPPGTKRAAAQLRAIFERYAPTHPIEGAVVAKLTWTFSGKRPQPKITRPDLDNLGKLALDAATKAGYWHDDAQVFMITTSKWTGQTTGIAFSMADYSNWLAVKAREEMLERIADGLRRLDWCIGYELTAEQQVLLDDLRGIALRAQEGNHQPPQEKEG